MKSTNLIFLIFCLFFVANLGCNYSKTKKESNKTAEEYVESATLKFKSQDLEGALQDCNKAIDLNPKCITAYIRRGETKFVLQDIDGACKDWRKAGDLGNDAGYRMAESTCGK